jgi:hypothetical protein
VHRVRVVGDVDVPVRQLLAKSYRPRTGCSQGRGERGDPLGKIRGSGDERLPKTLAAGRVEGRKDLTAAGVKHGQASGAPFPLHRGKRRTGTGCLPADGTTKRIQAADTCRRYAGAGRQAPGCRQPDPNADKGPWPAADGNPPHLLPAAAGPRRALRLGEQGGRVLGAAVGRQAECRLVQHPTAAHRADGRIGGRRIETDDRLLLGVQVSQ